MPFALLLLQLCLIALPILAYLVASRYYANHVYLATGIGFGLVAAPFSLALYGTFYIPYIGLPTGLVGLLSSMVHSAPGFHLAQWLGLVSFEEVISKPDNSWYTILNAFVWASAYGSLGWFSDWLRLRRQKRAVPRVYG
jgi:hypothetical protein